VEVLGRAKVNLLLAVGARRPDGYHEVTSVMQSVDLADTLVLRPAAATAVTFLPGPGFRGELPERPDLVAAALDLYRAELPEAGPVAAEVAKSIPLAAGLAGGSADAAAALLGADALRGGGTSRIRLEAMCRQLGSDVPFALRGGTALAGGRGERLFPLSSPHRLWWVLGLPGFPLRTAEVYERHDELSAASDTSPARAGGLIRALAAGHPRAIAAELRNDLEPAALAQAPPLTGLKDALLRAGAAGVVLSGSGPTLAALCRDEAHAEEVAARVEADFARVEVAPSADAGAEVWALEG
jgi:4-diphosphocytidyl-2-C-methyl-D-erythritol kinase